VARIEKVMIWSGWLRLSHLLVGLSTLVLLGSGWLIEAAPSLEADAVDLHYLAAGFLVFGLALRLVLMFTGSPVERLSRLMPDDGEMRALRETLFFYASFGRAPLPRWYAHNPLWKPLYLLIYLCLLFLVLTGWLRDSLDILWGMYLPSVHAVFASAIAWLTLLHLIAVVLHDYRGDAADLSGMVNGYRHFVVEDQPVGQVEPLASIRVQDIGRRDGD